MIKRSNPHKHANIKILIKGGELKMEEQVQTETQTRESTVVGTPEKVTRTTSRVVTPNIGNQHPQQVYKQKKALFHTYQIIWYILGIIETLLIFRIILKVLGANPNSGFTNLIYSLSSPFAVPFQGILQISYEEGHVFEWTTLIAMTVYAILAFGLIQLFQLIKPTTPEEVEQTVDNQ